MSEGKLDKVNANKLREYKIVNKLSIDIKGNVSMTIHLKYPLYFVKYIYRMDYSTCNLRHNCLT